MFMQYQQQKQASNGFAITSLVLGIIGVVLNIIVLLPYLLGTLAIVFGVIGVKNQHGKGMAIAGLTLGIIALSMKLIFWFFIFFFAGFSEY